MLVKVKLTVPSVDFRPAMEQWPERNTVLSLASIVKEVVLVKDHTLSVCAPKELTLETQG